MSTDITRIIVSIYISAALANSRTFSLMSKTHKNPLFNRCIIMLFIRSEDLIETYDAAQTVADDDSSAVKPETSRQPSPSSPTNRSTVTMDSDANELE